MAETVHLLFVQTWWRYTPDDRQSFTSVYHWFQVLEGFAWFVFAALVLRRFVKFRRSPLELWYAMAICSFGVTDFREAYAQSAWLKLFNLMALVLLRKRVMHHHYPEAKIF